MWSGEWRYSECGVESGGTVSVEWRVWNGREMSI